MTNIKRLSAGASLAILAMASASAVYAQETTSAVHGTVTQGGQPVAGAAVQLVHTPSGTKLLTSTENGGVFNARGLRIGGPYTITVTRAGAPPRELHDIYLTVGKTTDVDIDMAGVNEVEEIVVTAAGQKDTDQGPKTVLGRLAIQEVVSVSRDPRDLARRDMLVAADLNSNRGAAVNGGGISIAGSNPRYNRVAVDGVSAQDQFGLNQGGLTTARGPVNLDAIEQFAVAAVPTDVENGDFIGGALNLALRSGTNTLHGAVFYNYLNDGMVGRKSEDTKIKSAQSQTNYGLFLSGPIIEDKAFFAGSYELYKTRLATTFGLQGAGFPNAYSQNGNQATLDAFNSAFGTYASKFDAMGIAPAQPFIDKKYSTKLDWNITDTQRASLTYRYAESSSVATTSSNATTIQLDSANYTKFDSDEALTFELHSTWSDQFTTFFKATKRTFIDNQTPPSGQNFSDVRVCSAPASGGSLLIGGCEAPFDLINFGPDQFRHLNALSEKELRFQFTGEYTLGSNLFKFGGQARQAKPFDIFVPASHGVYYFDSLADFRAGNASELQYTNTVSGNPSDAAFNSTYWTYSAFMQDTLQITPDLKVSAGFRYDRYSIKDRPGINPNFLARNGFANDKTIDGEDVIMPRFSIEWRATPDLKLSGGFGLFSGGTPDVITGAPFYNNGYITTSVDIRRLANGTFTEANNTAGFTQAIGATALSGLNADPKFGYTVPTIVSQLQRGTLGGGAPQISPVGAVIALTPTFQMPAQYKVFLSGQWDVFNGWHLGADLVATKVQHDVTYYDARATPLVINGAQQFLPDGRIRYDGFANGTIPGKTSVNVPGGSNDLIVANTDKGHSYTASVSVSKSWDWGGEFAAGYAKSELRDVNAGLFFGSTAGSFYNSVPAVNDPNRDPLGRSAYEIPNRYKAEFGFHRNFWGDNETRINLFVERQDGRPFGFISTDFAGGRGQVFGVTKTAQALYVPDFKGDTNLNDLRVGLVTFATALDMANFKRYVDNFHLPNGQMVGKYSNNNPAINRADLSLSQQFPGFQDGHKFRVQMDIRNVLNLLSNKWGRVAEYETTSRLASVRCATAAGVAVAATDASCVGYLYSNVPTTVQKTVNQPLSLWYMQISLRYEF